VARGEDIAVVVVKDVQAMDASLVTLLPHDLTHPHLGMPVALSASRLFPILDRRLGAEMDARQALLAVTEPHGMAALQPDVVHWADALASTTAVAARLETKIGVPPGLPVDPLGVRASGIAGQQRVPKFDL
jgi:hypothetical protein